MKRAALSGILAWLCGGLSLLAAHEAAAHEFTYDIWVQCDEAARSAAITSTFPEENQTVAGAKRYDFDDLPQYYGHKPAQAVCRFGPNMRVALIGGRSDEHPNNDDLSIVINDAWSGLKLALQFGGNISVRFESSDRVHIDDCSNHPGQTQPCAAAQEYRTAYVLTSHNSPSFDCAKARTSAEILVCDDPGLSAADRKMAETYRKTLNALSDSARAKLIKDQRHWFEDERWALCLPAERGLFPVDITGAKRCLAEAYDKRVSALNELSAR